MVKMVIAIVSNDDCSRVLKGLVEKRYQATKLSSTGGFLNTGNTTLLIGCTEEQVSDVKKTIKEYCESRTKVINRTVTNENGFLTKTPVEVNVGGATIFVIDVEDFEKL